MTAHEAMALTWFKSSRSGGSGGQCVEVAGNGAAWYIRDSKNPTNGMLSVGPAAWRAFVDAVRADLR
ncbi:DUF397 domain-containing protein [Actinocatenispora comari]|jgi:hypothetical protein|uniref:DUF397 domain-containing protein n=1 Tax=Actinocatenispora comari TaxID=2807577 RepID=A0A8J4ELQ8_9ACTN|nr:DUF397 domain-containing protein [Actinocatenispora comari]GIL29527.1 hypothetical protein NUM_47810 [Actinocatenispora comari]